ncbi:MAG: hypothetical protein HC905_17395 [Bacteroidales bacterium]|nr:hypothetical protein [Bacteroidales bacterium]
METRLNNVIVILLFICSNLGAQVISLNDIKIKNQTLMRLNCNLKNFGEGKLLKSWKGDCEEFTLEYKILFYDSIEVLIANYKETNNSYLEMVSILSSRIKLDINGHVIKVGFTTDKLGEYLPFVQKEYISLVNQNNEYLLKESTVSTLLNHNSII